MIFFSQLITIWHWLPERMTMANPELIYSSNEHGISMTTFYQRTEQYEPTILVIKTTKSEVRKSNGFLFKKSTLYLLPVHLLTLILCRFLVLIVQLRGQLEILKMIKVEDSIILAQEKHFYSHLPLTKNLFVIFGLMRIRQKTKLWAQKLSNIKGNYLCAVDRI